MSCPHLSSPRKCPLIWAGAVFAVCFIRIPLIKFSNWLRRAMSQHFGLSCSKRWPLHSCCQCAISGFLYFCMLVHNANFCIRQGHALNGDGDCGGEMTPHWHSSGAHPMGHVCAVPCQTAGVQSGSCCLLWCLQGLYVSAVSWECRARFMLVWPLQGDLQDPGVEVSRCSQ